MKDGALYVAEISRVLRFDAIEHRLDRPPKPVVVHDAPRRSATTAGSSSRSGPTAGSTSPSARRATSASRRDRFTRPSCVWTPTAAGLRSSPAACATPWASTGTRHGRALVHRQRPRLDGRRRPARRAEPRAAPGVHFGYPFCHGERLPTPSSTRGRAAPSHRRRPAARPARGGARHALLHGHDVPRGLPRARLHRRARLLEPHAADRLPRHVRSARDGQPAVYEISRRAGCSATPWGRPVDVEMMPHGALLVSDDKAGAIYRITYRTPS